MSARRFRGERLLGKASACEEGTPPRGDPFPPAGQTRAMGISICLKPIFVFSHMPRRTTVYGASLRRRRLRPVWRPRALLSLRARNIFCVSRAEGDRAEGRSNPVV